MKLRTILIIALTISQNLLATSGYMVSNSCNINSQSSFWNRNLNENLTGAGAHWLDQDSRGKKYNGLLRYSRIPAMVITNNNTIVTMFDLRWNGANDQDRIDPGIAISKDGGHSWIRKTAWISDGTDNRKRTMDSTLLYDPKEDVIYALHGVWKFNSDQWAQNANKNYNNGAWAAQIHKSSDGGETWELVTEFNKDNNTNVYRNTFNATGKPVNGFLGGVGTGIVKKDGTLVFPIQTVHQPDSGNGNAGIGATIMYSTDNGQTWTMGRGVVAPNQSSLENMAFELDGKIILTGRGNNRWSYYTEDMGDTWHKYDQLDGFSYTAAQPTQGSSILVTLENGREVLLVSKPEGNNNDGWSRGNLALWVVDPRNKNNKERVGIFRTGSGNPKGAGYTSLAYKDGELLVAYEDDGNISIKNISDYMKTILDKSIEWNLPDTRDNNPELTKKMKAGLQQLQTITPNSNTVKARKENINESFYRAADIAPGTNSVNLGESVLASGENSIAIGTSALALKKNSISVGNENVISGENSIGIGNTNNVKNNSENIIVMGRENNIFGDNVTVIGHNNTIGHENKVSNIFVLGNNVSIEENKHDGVVLGDSSVFIEGAVSVGAPNHERKIVNVAKGISNGEVVTHDQLNPLAQIVGATISTKDGTIAQPTYTIAALKNGDNYDTKSVETAQENDRKSYHTVGDVVQAFDTEISKLKETQAAQAQRKISFVTNGTTISKGMGDTLKFVAGDNIAVSGDATKGEITVGLTDAVTGEQLHATNTNVDILATALGGNTKQTNGIVAPTYGLKALKDNATHAQGSTTTNYNNVGDALKALDDTIARFEVTETENNTFTFTANNGDEFVRANNTNKKLMIKSTESKFTENNKDYYGDNLSTKITTSPDRDTGTIEIGLTNKPQFETVKVTESITIGEDKKDSTKSSIKITKNGIDAGGLHIQNVANGKIIKNGTDAVNSGQIYEISEKFNNGINENKIAIIENQKNIVKLNKKMNKMVALSQATANLNFGDVQTGNMAIGAGVATFSNEQAVAVGVAYKPTTNLMMSTKISGVGTKPHYTSLGASITYQFNFK